MVVQLCHCAAEQINILKGDLKMESGQTNNYNIEAEHWMDTTFGAYIAGSLFLLCFKFREVRTKGFHVTMF